MGSWYGDRRMGGGGARHWAMAGEGAAEEHLQVLEVGNQAGDLAPLPQGATPWKWVSL